LVLVTSNRGLCGGFNAQIIQKTLEYIKSQQLEKEIAIELVVLGRKGRDFMIKRGQRLVAEFEKLDITTNITEIRPIARLLINDYIAGRFDKVVLAYIDFISTLIQKPRILELLPITRMQEEDKYLGKAVREESREATIKTDKFLASFEYIFEPSPDKVLNELLPRLLEMQIYQAILESDAAEHSARMVAMHNAADAASEMITDLTLAFNKARQASITAELADISGGRVVVE
jgi:F-type H+-transporting ATPase subunit gamma